MRFQFALVSLSCLPLFGCAANAEAISSLTNAQSNIDKKQIIEPSITRKKREVFNTLKSSQLNTDNSKSFSAELNSQLVQKSDNKEAQKGTYLAQTISTGTGNPIQLGSYMTLTPTGQTNALNNPLYELSLYANGQLVNRFMTVTGRTHTQNKNRHQSGTQAPLPDGRYTVSRYTIPGSIAEAGDLFLPIQPLFKTGRTDLGFHVDPSFEKNNGEDGTSGCIGLINKQHLSQVLNFVRTYRPKFIDVKIQ
ncbi:MAG: L,D-transpeptidase [Calothrix sp. MO_167.B12]|nr:L,D-transpeptidase [Calothrix sp. MO_167.B12]